MAGDAVQYLVCDALRLADLQRMDTSADTPAHDGEQHGTDATTGSLEPTACRPKCDTTWFAVWCRCRPAQAVHHLARNLSSTTMEASGWPTVY